jgi:hypothetical protein
MFYSSIWDDRENQSISSSAPGAIKSLPPDCSIVLPVIIGPNIAPDAAAAPPWMGPIIGWKDGIGPAPDAAAAPPWTGPIIGWKDGVGPNIVFDAAAAVPWKGLIIGC